jgi:transcriptional regulator with XRE-family HTH domain
MTSSRHQLEQVLAARIRSARRSMEGTGGRRPSQQHLADTIGVHVITVSQWERGKSAPTVANLRAIAEATGKPLSYFTGDADDEEESERRMRELVSLLMDRGQYDIASGLLEVVRLQVAHREEREAREVLA